MLSPAALGVSGARTHTHSQVQGHMRHTCGCGCCGCCGASVCISPRPSALSEVPKRVYYWKQKKLKVRGLQKNSRRLGEGLESEGRGFGHMADDGEPKKVKKKGWQPKRADWRAGGGEVRVRVHVGARPRLCACVRILFISRLRALARGRLRPACRRRCAPAVPGLTSRVRIG